MDQPMPFFQETYQCCLQLGIMTASQDRYASRNHLAGLMTTDKEYISNNDTAETIASTIRSHFANLSTQMAATIEANTMQVNVPPTACKH
jgi:hypothetical protein